MLPIEHRLERPNLLIRPDAVPLALLSQTFELRARVVLDDLARDAEVEDLPDESEDAVRLDR